MIRVLGAMKCSLFAMLFIIHHCIKLCCSHILVLHTVLNPDICIRTGAFKAQIYLIGNMEVTQKSLQMPLNHNYLKWDHSETEECRSPSLKMNWSVLKLDSCRTIWMPADQSQRQLLSLLTVRKENLDAEMHQVLQPGQNTDLSEWRCIMQPDRKRLHSLIICNIFCD